MSESVMRRLAPWALVAGAALFLGIFLTLKFCTNWSQLVILGSELSFIFFWKVIRALAGPVSAYPSLRKVQLLRALPVGIVCLAAFLAAWPVTSNYALWVLLVATLLYLVFLRPYIKRLIVEKAEPPDSTYQLRPQR